jgi:hypothetical protein
VSRGIFWFMIASPQSCQRPYHFSSCILRDVPAPPFADGFDKQQPSTVLSFLIRLQQCRRPRAGVPHQDQDPRPVDSNQSRTGKTNSEDYGAAIALVTSSETSSSVRSLRLVNPHSQSICRTCSRAHGTAPGSAPNSTASRSGHSLTIPMEAGASVGGLLVLALRTASTPVPCAALALPFGGTSNVSGR